MGLFSSMVNKFVPGPFYTDYNGDYPEDRPEKEEDAVPDNSAEPEMKDPPAAGKPEPGPDPAR